MDLGGTVLIINAGSSSIKAAIYVGYIGGFDTAPIAEVNLDKLGTPLATLCTRTNGQDDPSSPQYIQANDVNQAAGIVIDWVLSRHANQPIAAVGHRIVHGGGIFTRPTRLDARAMEQLRIMTDLDPDHLPAALALIDKIDQTLPGIPQVGCFDTALYSDMPRMAQMIAVPRKYEAMGLRRYGFHGLSYSYLLDQFQQICGETAAKGRIIFAHLGSGVSLTAFKDGQAIDTTMGFTPASGVPMSTRSGDIDPGLIWFLNRQENLSIQQINQLLNKRSGLLGVSETSANMYELLQNMDSDIRAAEAVKLFCYQVRKAIGALTTTIGGVDSIVFAGGMGENAPKIRQLILDNLDYLGIKLDEQANDRSAECISAEGSQVGVHVFHTDEGLVILKQTSQLLAGE